MIANAPETIESEEWAVETARAANPRADVGELRHRIKHALKRAPDGALTWKYARDVREMMRRGSRRDPVELWDRLTRITCPTLLVRGAESDVLSPELAQRVVAALPHGRLVEVAAAGHTVPGDRPAEFVEVVRRFLASPARCPPVSTGRAPAAGALPPPACAAWRRSPGRRSALLSRGRLPCGSH